MDWLDRFSVRSKLYLLVTLALLGVIAMAGVGLFLQHRTSEAAAHVMERELQAVVRLGQARASVGNIRRFEKDVFLNMGNEPVVEDYLKRWRQEVGEASSLMQALLPVLQGDEPEQVQAMLNGLEAYKKGFGALVKRMEIGQLNDPWAANAAMEPLKGDVRAMDKALDVLSSSILQRVEAQRTQMAELTERLLLGGGSALLLLAVLLVVLGRLVADNVRRRVAQAARALERVAEGDLTHDIQDNQSGPVADELVQMLSRLSQTQQSLRHLVAMIQGSASGVASASAQIASGSGQLAERTLTQVSNLQETTVSMEQLTGTVSGSSQTALQASELAALSSNQARESGTLVQRVVSTMQEIGSSSARMADIIGVIDSIAFQTNILALNAAVEAARAGEQGRGFAVVAAEVRALAGRTSEAAREVKQLITSSVERVEGGTALVHEAGQRMQVLVNQVQETTDLITQLSQATLTQQAGIEQVERQVSQLEQLTQDNLQLVQHSTIAADQLRSDAEKLVQAAGAFRVA